MVTRSRASSWVTVDDVDTAECVDGEGGDSEEDALEGGRGGDD